MHIRYLGLLLIGSGALFQTLSAQVPKVILHEEEIWENPEVRFLNSKNGLPQNSVEDIIIGSNSLMWLATQGGIVRFDGQYTKLYTKAQLGRDRFRSFYRANDSIYSPSYLKDLAPLQINLHQIEPTPVDSSLWDRPMFVEHSTWYRAIDSIENFGSVYAIRPDYFLINSAKNPTTYYWYKDGEIRHLNYQIPAANNTKIFVKDSAIYCIDQVGQVWHLGDYEKTLEAKIPAAVWADLKDGPFIWKAHSNQSFLLSAKTLYSLDKVKGEWILRARINYNFDFRVLSILEDTLNQQIFMGTQSDGLAIFKRKSIQQVNLVDSCGNDVRMLNVIYLDGKLYNNTGISLYDDKVNCDPWGFYVDQYNCLIDTANKRLYTWVLPPSWGFYEYSPSGLGTYHPLDSNMDGPNADLSEVLTRENAVNDFCLIKDKLYYYRPQKGLCVLEKGEHQVLIPIKEDFKVYQLFPFGPDGMLMSTTQGLFNYNLKDKSELALKGGTGQLRYLSMIDDVLWSGSYGDGVFYLPPQSDSLQKFHLFGYPELAYCHEVLELENDLLFTTNSGLVLISKTDIQKWFRGDTIIQPYRFGPEDGLLNPEFNGTGFPAHQVLDDGRIAFSAILGFNVFNPKTFKKLQPADKIELAMFKLRNGDLAIEDGVYQLPSSFSALLIKLVFPYLGTDRSNAILYYRIPQIDESWTEYNFKEGINLNPPRFGNYTLEVYAPSIHQQPLVLSQFKVNPPFYWQAWFITLIVLVLYFLVYLFVKRRDKIAQAQKAALELLVEERTLEIAQANGKLMQALETRNKMISIFTHDIKGPARFLEDIAITVKSKLAENKQDNVEQELGYLQGAARGFTERVNSVLAWIAGEIRETEGKEEKVVLAAVWDKVMLEHGTFARGHDILLEANWLVPSQDLNLMFQAGALEVVLNNILTNAIRHAQNLVKCTAAIKEGVVLIQVEDDGGGITDPDKLKMLNQAEEIGSTKARRGAMGTGLGLLIVHDLIRKYDSKIYFSNTDIGLKVELRIPLA